MDELSHPFEIRRKKRIPYLNIGLFIITLITTLLAGALQQGVNPITDHSAIWKGVPFSFTLLLILGAHEFGHYFMSRRRQVDVTLPYFIPAPSFIGTFGAFIKMKSPIMDRRTLLDIGTAGPLTGVIVSLPILLVGLALSKAGPESIESGLTLGSSLLFSAMTWIVHGSLPENMNLVLHPAAFSGWIGLLVTSLNLLPVGQLDGGHVGYAIFGHHQRIISRIVIVALIFLGFVGWTGWLVWAALLFFLGIDHPPVVYEWVPLDPGRKIVGWITLGVFGLTFTPVPF